MNIFFKSSTAPTPAETPIVFSVDMPKSEVKKKIEIIDYFLDNDEYYKEEFEKTTIYLHHTAGGHHPEYVIQGWTNDYTIDKVTQKSKARVVGTAYVIGGLSTSKNLDSTYEGKIYRAFEENMWAHHLGLERKNNRQLNRISIGIEICNYGPIVLSKTGTFFNYVNKPVPASAVIKLDQPFRGYSYYHKYTDKQLSQTRDLILYLKDKYPSIDLRTPLTTVEGFEINQDALTGIPGLYSHSNVRADKFDLSPQPKVIEMIKSL